MTPNEILCIGEILWDSLPAGLFVGGAPFNVAGHLSSLGLSAAIVTRVGSDRLGEEAIRRAERLGVATDLIQVDPELPTGFVLVELEEIGSPRYDIVAPAAWDAIELTEAVRARAEQARAVVFGSLAQRGAISRATVQALSSLPVTRVFDVNLRPPHDDPDVVRRSLEGTEVVKLNEAELSTLSEWFGLPHGLREGAQSLVERLGCGTVCITRGESGSAMLRDGQWTEHPGYPIEVVDTVGSGDGFLAAFLAAYLEGAPDEAILRRANLLGALVASRPGAIPTYDAATLDQVRCSCPPTADGRSAGREINPSEAAPTDKRR